MNLPPIERSHAVSAKSRMMSFVKTTIAGLIGWIGWIGLAAPLCAQQPLFMQEPPLFKNCSWCHGPSAQGLASAPRLAGQRQEYLENQLFNFVNHSRDNPYSKDFMWHAVANLSPDAMRDLADYLSTLPPVAARDGERDLVAEGRHIYELGVPDSNIAACVVCHGPNAEGVRQIPRLGGLEYSYVKRRLEEWGQGYHASAWPMPRVAGKLSAQDIEALASYLSYVE